MADLTDWADSAELVYGLDTTSSIVGSKVLWVLIRQVGQIRPIR
jgi:hypothetical protein